MAPSHLAWSTSCGGGGASPSPPLQHQTGPGGGVAEEQRTRDYVSGRAARAGQQWWSSARGGPSPSGDGRPAIPSRYQLHLLPPCPSLLYHLLFVFVLDLIS